MRGAEEACNGRDHARSARTQITPTGGAEQAGRAFGRLRAGLESIQFESQIGSEGSANEPDSNQG
jgi:hypothetical protein